MEDDEWGDGRECASAGMAVLMEQKKMEGGGGDMSSEDSAPTAPDVTLSFFPFI